MIAKRNPLWTILVIFQRNRYEDGVFENVTVEEREVIGTLVGGTSATPARFGLASLMTLILVSTLATTVTSASILIEDFNDGNDDGWTHEDITGDTPWGPAVIDVNGKGEYRFASAGTVPGWARAGGGFFSTWDGSADPLYSDGFLRARMRIGDADLTTGLCMRLDFPDAPPSGYCFSLRNRSWEPYLTIGRLQRGTITESVREPFTLHVDEDLMIEAGAVGDQLSLKVWPADEAEPSTPQLEWSDSTLTTGLIGLVAQIDGYATLFNSVDVVFDDLYFTPSGDMANATANNVVVPEPTGLVSVLLAAACLAMFARKTHQGILVLGLVLPIFCAAPVRGQTATFDLGSFRVISDHTTSNHRLPIPAGVYNTYVLTTDWSDLGGGAWSQEALWTVADGALGDPATHYYANPGKAPNAAGNGSSQQLEWEGWLDIPLSGQRDVTLIAVETFPNSSARWSNTVLELSYQTPPTAPALDTDLGTIAHEFAPFSIVTTGDLDSELAVYSSTGVVLAKNDDAVGATVNSALHFDYGLPPGQYIAAVGGFNTSFANDYDVIPGASSGDFGLELAGKPAAGSLAAGQVAYLGFSVSILGDVNGDNLVDVKDIDDLSIAIQSGSSDLSLDLNDDKTVTAEDHQMLVSDILQTWLGDADLDGDVDFPDFLTLANHFDGPGGWGEGDFNADGQVLFADFLILANNYGKTSTTTTTAVPEPSAVLPTLLGLSLLAGRGIRKRRFLVWPCSH